jgi:hypothetical protein
MKIVDNALPDTLANEIEALLFSNNFPWFFMDDITYRNNPNVKDKTMAFSHLFYSNGAINSDSFGMIKVIPNTLGETGNMLLARSFLQLPVSTTRLHNNIHIDYETPHTVCLYYVNDTDGDTFIFANDKKTITQRISPKKNRCVVFNGSTYHASSAPTKDKRAIINFDLSIA